MSQLLIILLYCTTSVVHYCNRVFTYKNNNYKMLQIEKLTFGYRRSAPPVIDGLDMTLCPGGIYGLLGRNGAGKSTLLYLMAGLLKPQCGRVLYNKTDTRLRMPSTLADIYIVPEEYDLPDVRLEHYLQVNAPFYPRFSYDDFKGYLNTMDLTPDLHLGRLSMGQKKKVVVSFALACNTGLLLMDEPSNGLDIPGKSRFRKALVSAMNDERIIVVSTHQVRDVDSVLDRVLITDGGRVLLDATMDEIGRKLLFGYTASRAAAENALYAQPAPGGANIVLLKDAGSGDNDTLSQPNLEVLFELAMNNPGLVAKIFKDDCNE